MYVKELTRYVLCEHTLKGYSKHTHSGGLALTTSLLVWDDGRTLPPLVSKGGLSSALVTLKVGLQLLTARSVMEFKLLVSALVMKVASGILLKGEERGRIRNALRKYTTVNWQYLDSASRGNCVLWKIRLT